MAIYEQYARVYDRSGQLAFSLRMINYLARVLERHPVEGRVMLELASGTGTVAIAMARKGWRVYGVDGSEGMLAQARAKVDRDKLPLYLSQQDMREFMLPERVSLATCLYDSMNYMLSEQDLLAVFRRVYTTLQPGGLFAFDMNTAWAFATFWDGETYYTDTRDLATVMQSEYDAVHQRAIVTVTCFERVDDLYRKISEQHIEQAYPPEQIATLLCDVGFAVEAQYNCFTFQPPSATASRIMFLARRPA